ncbi:hypothetical protein VNO77_01852 [Canavalia gladiata]|uniref:Uncharacterized protein n=1 Tax=Canavalia gladiata TaxID=3824 RepID=A0AAN9R2H7_CANGL
MKFCMVSKKMLNGASKPTRELTFLMADDREVSSSSISVDEIQDFLLRHAIPMPLYFNDLSHSLVPHIDAIIEYDN